MKRNEDEYYQKSIDETIEVLRTIEFLKIAMAFVELTPYTGDIRNRFGGTPRSIPYYIKQHIGSGKALPYTSDNSVAGDYALKTNDILFNPSTGGGGLFMLPIHITIQYLPTNFVVDDTTSSSTSINATSDIHDLSGTIRVSVYDAVGTPVPHTIETVSGGQTITGTGETVLDGLFRAFKLMINRPGGSIEVPSNGVELTSITIKKSVQNIGEYTFYNCTKLSNVNVNSFIDEYPAFTFYGCTNLTNLPANNFLKVIGPSCFAECTGFRNIRLPKGLTTIGLGAFQGCSNLTSITIYDKIEEICYLAFARCMNLRTINCYAKTPPTIGDDVFDVASNGYLNLSSNLTEEEQELWTEWLTTSGLEEKGWQVYFTL